MDRDDLYKVAQECRAYIESANPNDFPWNSHLGSGRFPKGCCGDASRELAHRLCSRYKISVEYFCGENGGRNHEIRSHAWLECEGFVIDITADQFNDKNYNFPEVYVGEKNEWYRSFRKNDHSSREITCD